VPVPGVLTFPGRRSSKRSKFRPFKGRAFISWLLTVPPMVASVVLIAGNLRGHCDGLGLRAGLQHQIDANVLADLHENVGVLEDLEPFGLTPDRIRSRRQVESYIRSGTIRDQSLGDTPSHIGDRHRCASNGAAALVKDRALDAALIGLREGRKTSQKQHDHRRQKPRGSLCIGTHY